MKKKFILLLFLCSLSFLGMHAQTEKGQWLVGATTSGFSFAKRQGVGTFNANLNPTVGYFAANNLATGLRVGTYLTSSINGFLERYKNYGISVSAFGRYYIPLSQRLKIPIDLEAGISTGTSKSRSVTASGSSFNVGAHTGLSYFINSRASIDFLAGYSGYKPLNNGSSQSWAGNLNGQLGFSLYLGGKGEGK
jgi:hypothetical protein